MSSKFVLSHFSWLLTAAALAIFGAAMLPTAFYHDSREDQIQLNGKVTYLYVNPGQTSAETVFTFQVKDLERTFSVTGLSLGNAAMLATERLGTEFSFSVEAGKLLDESLTVVPVTALSSRKGMYLRTKGF